MPTIPPDAVVRGATNTSGTEVNLEAMLWCLRGAPSGFMNGTFRTTIPGGSQTFQFATENPTLIEAMTMPRSVFAAFENVSLQQNTYTPITRCRAYLTAVGVGYNTWLGSLVIIRPDGSPLVGHGYFGGELQVYRQVMC